jgi:hypothetical protein
MFYGRSVHFVVIWYFFRFGMLYREKSGNPATNAVAKADMTKQHFFA